jgi:hypothetical protein
MEGELIVDYGGLASSLSSDTPWVVAQYIYMHLDCCRFKFGVDRMIAEPTVNATVSVGGRF